MEKSKLVIGISSRALFDLDDSHKIFEKEGVDAYKEHQILNEDKILNPEGLRFSDEFVRHKLLDFIGDIALSGKKIIGSFFTSQSGHKLNIKLIQKIFESEKNYKLVSSN